MPPDAPGSKPKILRGGFHFSEQWTFVAGFGWMWFIKRKFSTLGRERNWCDEFLPIRLQKIYTKKTPSNRLKAKEGALYNILCLWCDHGSWINLPIEASKTDYHDGVSGFPVSECRQASPTVKSVMTCICLYPNRQIRLANLDFQQVVGRPAKNLDYATDA